MNRNTFIVSDETKNSYGMIVKTDGINLETFLKNPIMLYMHERRTVVGRWENIRKNGSKLLADAVFDDSTELGRTVKKQVEKGFLRSASIGIEILETITEGETTVVTESLLNEISIVDIPANENALKLRYVGGKKFLKLEAPHKVKNLHDELISLLELSENATDEDIISTIQDLLNAPDQATTEVENAINEDLINAEDRYNYITLARISPNVFSRFLNGEKKKKEKTVLNAVNQAFEEGRIKNLRQKEIYQKIALKMGLGVLSDLITVNIIRPSDILRMAKGNLSQKKEIPVDPSEKLMYYRKNDPDYLKEHPEEFERLLNAALK